MTRVTLALALACALLAGALGRDLFVSSAAAGDTEITRSDVDRIVRALEANAQATKEVAHEVRDAGRGCSK